MSAPSADISTARVPAGPVTTPTGALTGTPPGPRCDRDTSALAGGAACCATVVTVSSLGHTIVRRSCVVVPSTPGVGDSVSDVGPGRMQQRKNLTENEAAPGEQPRSRGRTGLPTDSFHDQGGSRHWIPACAGPLLEGVTQTGKSPLAEGRTQERDPHRNERMNRMTAREDLMLIDESWSWHGSSHGHLVPCPRPPGLPT